MELDHMELDELRIRPSGDRPSGNFPQKHSDIELFWDKNIIIMSTF